MSYIFWRTMSAPYSVLICLIKKKKSLMQHKRRYCCPFASQCLLVLGSKRTIVSSLGYCSESLYSDLPNILRNVAFFLCAYV